RAIPTQRRPTSTPELHPLTELRNALRQLRLLGDVFWEIAYGRVKLSKLWEGRDAWSTAEEQGIRILLALALAVPEPLLRAQFERVTADGATAVDVAMLVQPLVEAQRVRRLDPMAAWSSVLQSMLDPGKAAIPGANDAASDS